MKHIYTATESATFLFADVTIWLAQHSNLKDLISFINVKLHKLGSWFKSNKMAVNVSKTKYIIVRTRVRIAIYAPINFTAPCIIFSGGFFSLRGGLDPGTRDCFGAREIAQAVRRVRFGAQKSQEFQGPIPRVMKNISLKT